MTEYSILMPLLVLAFGMTPIVIRDPYPSADVSYELKGRKGRLISVR